MRISLPRFDNMSAWRDLNPTEDREFRAWARAHYKTDMPIDPLWHPVVREECREMQVEVAQRRGGFVA